MTRNRIPWTQYFMTQALVIAQRSTCNRALVGNVLVKDNRIIATGYNGSPYGQAHCDDVGHQLVDGHCVRTIHSEINSLLQCASNGISTQNSEIYVTHYPCYYCSKALVQAGVRKVNYVYDYRVDPLSEKLFKDTGVVVNKVDIDPKYINNLLEELAYYASFLCIQKY